LDLRRIRALATDYDGTLATRGQVPKAVTESLQALKISGRRMILVTGRQLPDLQAVFAEGILLFDLIVAENGALLYWPDSSRTRALAEPAPPALIRALEWRQVRPLEIGRVIVATVVPYDQEARDAIQELGINWKITMNRESVMLLPRGVNKASGLREALAELGLTAAETCAVGDAENDRELFAAAGLRAAVANAVPSLKALADIVTREPEGAGVTELVAEVLKAA
jgi:hydroxymethylpyrimidine pyrophosphatase-like HAD family hydrolase